MNKYDLYWGKIPFEHSSQSKLRPVIIRKVLDSDMVRVIPITSTPPRSNFAGEVRLRDWEAAGLDHQSTARCFLAQRLPIQDLRSRIGHLTEWDIENLELTIKEDFVSGVLLIEQLRRMKLI